VAPSKFFIELHPWEIEDLLRNPGGPVAGRMLEEAGRVVTRGARIRAPVAQGYIAPGRPAPGFLYNSIGFEHGADAAGAYIDIYAAWYDRFLEKPAKQIPRARRTLRNALHDLPRII